MASALPIEPHTERGDEFREHHSNNGTMRILVAIANHGTKNDHYARRLIDEYRGMSHDVHIVILSNLDKDWGSDVEVIVGAPTKDPWSLPFGHKNLFAERLEDFDVFVYSEDDTLLAEKNIDSFLRATQLLGDDEIAGFLRSEQNGEGDTFLSTVHSFYHWDPSSLKVADDHTFAYYTNEHAALYVLTREQLRRAIASGGFLVEPHEGRYDLLVTAATDPYTQCGFRKLICISHVDEFILQHLPSAYVGRMGLPRAEFDVQIQALRAVEQGERATDELLVAETRCWHANWSKNYYEPRDEQLISSVAESSESVLSIGCGWGETEAAMVASGRRVVGVALDAVIAACAESRGIEVVYGSIGSIIRQLEAERFDTLIFGNVLHVIAAPSDALKAFMGLLAPGGEVIVKVPNFNYAPTVARRLCGVRGYRGLGDYETLGFHASTASLVGRWFAAAGLRVERLSTLVSPPFRILHRGTLGLLREFWSRDLVVTGKLR